MILADTSAWIGYFRDTHLPQSRLIDEVLEDRDFVMGDLVLVEVLQGLRTLRESRLVGAAIAQIPNITLCGPQIAPIAAENYRILRREGITVRSTIDVIIATWCIENGASLIHSDRDFEPLRKLGLTIFSG